MRSSSSSSLIASLVTPPIVAAVAPPRSLAATWPIVLAAALAACTSSGGAGDKCSSTKPCTGGAVCDMTNPGGPVCIDGSGDLDGDGIPNNKDFCNHMAGGQFDEDGDGIGDECDACPIAKPPTTADGDNDMVDAPCDPDTTMGGDKIVLFNGFNGALPNGWKATAGWTFTGGDAVAAAAGASETITVPLPVPSNQVALLAAYRVDTSSTSADAGVSAASRLPMGVTLTSCGATRAAVGGDNVQATSNVGTQTKSAMNLFDPASHYRFGEHIDGGTINCGLIADKETGAVTNGYNGELVNEVGIYARGATLRFAYLLVMSR